MHTGLSPEWDRRYDEVFTDLISHDDDLVRAEFTGLTQACWPTGRTAAPWLPDTDPGARHRDG
jgi:hypothetical protein